MVYDIAFATINLLSLHHSWCHMVSTETAFRLYALLGCRIQTDPRHQGPRDPPRCKSANQQGTCHVFCCCHCQRCLKKSTAGWKLHQETRPESKKLWASCDVGTWFVHIFGPKSGGEALERPLETPSIWRPRG